MVDRQTVGELPTTIESDGPGFHDWMVDSLLYLKSGSSFGDTLEEALHEVQEAMAGRRAVTEEGTAT